MGWLNKYPDGGTVKPPKTKIQPINFVQQDNLRQLPMFDAREISRANSLKKETYVSQSKEKSLYQQKIDLNKKKQYADANPNAKLVNGQLEEINPNRSLTGRAVSPNAKRLDKGLEHILDGLDAASYITGAGALAKPLLRKAATYLTEKTALKNAYKLNPYAFKPSEGMMYRGIGKEGVDDALSSGVFRAKQYNLPKNETFRDILNRPKNFNNTYYSQDFKVADNYGKGYIAEVPENSANFYNRYSNRNPWSKVTNEQIPIEKGKILKKDWIKGYKEVPKNTNGDVWWNGKGYQSTPTSSKEIVRGPIDYSQEPNFRGRNPIFNAEAYGNSVKTPYVPPTTDPKLMSYLNTEKIVGSNSNGALNPGLTNITQASQENTQTGFFGWFKKSKPTSEPKSNVVYSHHIYRDNPKLSEEAMNYAGMRQQEDLKILQDFRNVEDGEAWKYSPEEVSNMRNKYTQLKNQQDQGLDYWRNYYITKLQNSQKGKIVFDIDKYRDPTFMSSTKPEQWYGGLNDKFNMRAWHQSDFKNYKTNSSLSTYEKAKDAGRQDAGKVFKSLYKEHEISPLDLVNLPKNRNGGTINGWLNKY